MHLSSIFFAFSTIIVMITFASASGTPLTNLEAFTRLDAAGISVSSSGGCDDKTKKQCTSLDGVLSDTIDGIITLKRACGCSINITGGTEIGHKNEPYSHGTGYKLDISKYPEVSSYIKRTFKRIDDRPTGEPQWQSDDGNIYFEEGTHWDILYK